ncbi:Flp pilus assembly protein CpaB [Cupriavidus basilensis OR16]|uniref:Flp pilus assembly protein CpaB n=1 Tax=Cupriavidus basilensis OR16 TaxID=1127483 RepID=H1SBY3_9BURK|nr:Flp pilus assembly protein CpaB [Cupriavidus basilensis]EHP39962.1 Flp pilus assembly protein CpaB [Cupriavidus basilensis OR16]
MTSKQIRVLAIALLVLAALLALLAWRVARAPAKPAEPVAGSTQLYPVVVTVKPIEAGKPVPVDALKVEQLPINPAGAYTEVARVAGQVPVIGIGANVPVLESQLLAGLATQVKEGERAVAVAVDEVIGVGNQVQPGDFVDVFAVFRRDGQEIEGSQARMLLARLRVLAYGAGTVNETAKPAPEQMMARREGAKTAVLAVPVANVGKLAIAQQTGRLLLALRNPEDPDVPTEGLFDDPAPVLQAKVPAKGGALTATLKGGALTATLAPSDRAMAGVALAGIAGGARRDALAVKAALSPVQAPAAIAQRAHGVSASSVAQNSVEMIRGGKREIE